MIMDKALKEKKQMSCECIIGDELGLGGTYITHTERKAQSTRSMANLWNQFSWGTESGRKGIMLC